MYLHIIPRWYNLPHTYALRDSLITCSIIDHNIAIQCAMEGCFFPGFFLQGTYSTCVSSPLVGTHEVAEPERVGAASALVGVTLVGLSKNAFTQIPKTLSLNQPTPSPQ